MSKVILLCIFQLKSKLKPKKYQKRRVTRKLSRKQLEYSVNSGDFVNPDETD
jgi:hypothetical protein